jgi:exosortase/archaeosortase family protein
MVAVVGLAVVLALVYAPLLIWLGKVSWQVTQLTNGAALVLFAMWICLRTNLQTLRVAPRITTHGLGLLFAGIFCLWLPHHTPLPALPLLIVSFAFSLAAIIAFVFGRIGVRQFRPALGGFVVFGLLIGLFPALDWPLRTVAAKYAAQFMHAVGLPVELRLVLGGPPELMLSLQGRHYIVAAECNGFGLLTWVRKAGVLLWAVPVAIGCNFLRIVSICYLAPRVPLSYHAVHEILGNLFYLLGLALVWITARRATTPVVEKWQDILPGDSGRAPLSGS